MLGIVLSKSAIGLKIKSTESIGGSSPSHKANLGVGRSTRPRPTKKNEKS